MAISDGYRDFVLEQLQLFGEVTSKSMFGGLALYSEGEIFGLIADDTFYLKVDDINRAQFEEEGMPQFCPEPKKQGMPYYAVPIHVIEDQDVLAEWARRSWDVARRIQSDRAPKA